MKCLILLFSLLTIYHQVLADSMDGARALNDEEQIESETYIHEGLTREALNSACESYRRGGKTYNDLCTNDKDGFAKSGAQAVEQMVPIASTAYSMFSNLSQVSGGGGITKSTGNYRVGNQTATSNGDGSYSLNGETISSEEMQQREQSGQAQEETESAQDYCQYIPLATELAAQAYQIIQTNQISRQYNIDDGSEQQVNARNRTSNGQIESMHAVAATQKQRSRAASVQAAGWGSTAACYTVYMATSSATGVNIDAKMVLKASSAALLTTFYAMKAKAHMQRNKAINNLIASLPKEGQCNPHTATTCFCNEESSATTDASNFAKYCIPNPFRNRDPSQAFVCINQQRQVDSECNCASSGTCFDVRVRDGALSLGLSPSSLNDLMQDLTPISRGLAGNDILARAEQRAAMANRMIQKHVDKITPFGNLNKKQTDVAKEIVKAGVPAVVASNIAATGLSAKVPSSISGAGGSIANLDIGDKNAKRPNRESGLSFESSSSGNTRSKRRSESSFNNPFAKKKKDTRGGGQGVEVMDFYSQAEQNATINKDKDQHLFNIISHRYKMSAWKRFDEVKQELEETPENQK